MTAEQRRSLLKSQQGELDAVLMYQALAKTVKNARDAETFRQLAAEEGRHAAVFHGHTSEVLKPKKTKAILLPILYRVIGRKRLYPIIAKGEYDAAAKYEHLIRDFPEVQSIKDDETRHGDTVLALL